MPLKMSKLATYETDDEVLQGEIIAELEKEFGPMVYPTPRGPVFHQSLSSDFELGIVRPDSRPDTKP